MTSTAPIFDPRSAADVAADIAARVPAYAPGWTVGAAGSGAALIAIYSRFARALIERVNRAPDKHELAFLDLLGVDLLPAHAARAPLVFTALPTIGDSQVPAGTRVGAKVAGRTDPISFETEQPIGLAVAHLAEVVTVWPGRDAYADHSAAVTGGLPITLWSPLAPVAHELYLAHDVYFALSGAVTVEIDVVLTRAGNAALATTWEYWDGDMWRALGAFQLDPLDLTKSYDGTLGLTRSGTIRLAAECTSSVPTAVAGVMSHWIRGRVAGALPPQPERVMPEIDRLSVRSVIDRSIPAGGAGFLPDSAFANGVKLDLSKTFFPLGEQAGPGSVLAFTHAEAFAKAGATLTIEMSRSKTAAEQSDDLTAGYETQVNAAKTLLATVLSLARDTILPALTALRDGDLTASPVPLGPPLTGQNWSAVFAAMQTKLQAVIQEGIAAIAAIAGLPALVVDPIAFAAALVGLGVALKDIGDYFSLDGAVLGSLSTVVSHALAVVNQVIANINTLIADLLAFSPETLAVAAGAKPPQLGAPDVEWEYWDGDRWRALALTASEADALILQPAPGVMATLTFTVPNDWEVMTLNGVSGRFMRARLAHGAYGQLRTVSWTDQTTGLLHFMPIIENRPPMLDTFTLGYLYSSPIEPAERCVTHGDFQWTDHTLDAATPGDPFTPFAPIEDTAPTLYLGFDAPLPADALGIWLGIDQDDAMTSGPSLRWEYADGASWLPLSVDDETAGLALPGIVTAVYPGVEPVPSTTVVRAAGTSVTLQLDRNVPRFNPGDVLYIQSDGAGELATVAARGDSSLELVTPLGQSYNRGTIGRALLARFGTPRTWIRARLDDAVEPPRSTVTAIASNAVWASQRQTIANELLGSSNGQPSQVFFFANAPVLPEETIEVRELDGARANVEYEILRRELLALGIGDDAIRTVVDSRTLQITEVWVRWVGRPTLLFSGPGDRNYTVERTRGRLLFGDGEHGLVPPPGVDNVRAVQYRSGGGPDGNVAGGAVSQLLSGVLAQKVANIIAADGGSLGEGADAVLSRGPRTVRHRRQAISQSDYEALAREASPAVALARAQPTTDASRRTVAGAVTLFIVPQSSDARPVASFELRREVLDFLEPRVPIGARPALSVEPATYLDVGVEATIAVLPSYEAAAVRAAALAALAAFLHPLTGGPEGSGWPYGRSVYMSDAAAMLEAIEGVDFVSSLVLLSDGTARGDVVIVPPDRLVAAGDLRVTLTAPER